MDRRRFLRAAALAAGYAMSRGILVPAWASTTRESAAEESGSLYSPRELRDLAGSGITVVDTISDTKGDLNAGGLTPWPGNGWYGVYMKTVFSEPPKKKNKLFGRQTATLLGSWGSASQLPGFGFDPGVLIGAGGGRIVTWHTSGVGVQVTKSNQSGWDSPQILADDNPGITAEATCGMFAGVQMACYAWRESVNNQYSQQVRVRTGSGAYSWSDYVTAASSMGAGPGGQQQRSTLCESGRGGEVLCFYHQAHGGQNRTIRKVLSSDGGRSFGAGTDVAVESGYDLHNPFGILLSSGQLRCYYQRYKASATPKWTLGWVSSNDGGRTWSSPKTVTYPTSVNSSSRPVFAELSDGTIVVWTSWDDNGIRTLGLFPV